MSNVINDTTDEMLINVVQNFEFIYDKKSSKFKDKIAKENAWKSIGSVLGKSAEECEQRFNILRNRFNTEKRKQLEESASGSGAPKRKIWELYESMQFLNKYIVSRRTTGNYKATKAAELENETIEPEEAEKQLVDSENSKSMDDIIYSEEDNSQPVEAVIMTPPHAKITGQLLQEHAFKKKKNNQDPLSDNLSQALSTMNSYLKRKVTDEIEIDDECQAFGQTISRLLRKIKRKKIRKLAMADLLKKLCEYDSNDDD